jgi:hypothetical protein
VDERGDVRMEASRYWAVLVLALVLLGCLQAGPSEDPAGGDEQAPGVSERWADEALPHGSGHDHTKPTHHRNLSTPTIDLLGYDPLSTEYHGATSGDYTCGGVGERGDRQLLAAQSFDTDVAVVIADVTDPSEPNKLGELALPNTQVWGIEMTEDARHVLLGTSPTDDGPDDAPRPETHAAGRGHSRPTWTDACGTKAVASEDPIPYDSGLVVVDVSDPSSPEVADYAPLPIQGGHTVFSTTLDGTTYVLAGVANQAHAASYFSFFTLEETPAGTRLAPYGEHASSMPAGPERPPVRNGHVDGWIQRHPVTNQLLAYLANWNGGIRVVELQGPGQIEEVGRWNDWRPDAGETMVGNWHTVRPARTAWEGNHYTFVGQEVGNRPAERPTGQILMLDTTDPANPEPVARWTFPADVVWEKSLQFTTHYVDLHEPTRRLFVTAAHGGLWAVDVDPSTARDGQLDSLGVFLPARVPPNPPPDHVGRFASTPLVSETWHLGDGVFATLDSQSGLYTVTFDEDASVPVPEPWTRDGWAP